MTEQELVHWYMCKMVLRGIVQRILCKRHKKAAPPLDAADRIHAVTIEASDRICAIKIYTPRQLVTALQAINGGDYDDVRALWNAEIHVGMQSK